MRSTLHVTDARAPAGGLYPLAYMNSFGGDDRGRHERDPAQHPGASACSASRSRSSGVEGGMAELPGDFGFGADEEMLRDSARRFFEDRYSPRQAARTGRSRPRHAPAQRGGLGPGRLGADRRTRVARGVRARARRGRRHAPGRGGRPRGGSGPGRASFTAPEYVPGDVSAERLRDHDSSAGPARYRGGHGDERRDPRPPRGLRRWRHGRDVRGRPALRRGRLRAGSAQGGPVPRACAGHTGHGALRR